jgi:dTDP-4-dehydrorhamnose reductase
MKRILLFGKGGQVGWELQRSLAPLGELIALDVSECDFTDARRLRQTVRETRPDVIVNAAAYTAVDRAESEPDLANAINGFAPGVLAEEAKAAGAWLVHYSTDYVYDGAKSLPFVEEDAVNPLSVYGASKLAGDQAIVRVGGRYLVFRTSWVFAARGGNFARTMLKLAAERDRLRVVADQFGAPTSAELIADVTALCLRQVLQAGADSTTASGVYHLVAAGETSWHGYARHVLAAASAAGVPLRCLPDSVEPIATSAYPLPARRPANSRLDTTKLRRTFDLCLPDWRFHADRMLAEILSIEASGGEGGRR